LLHEHSGKPVNVFVFSSLQNTEHFAMLGLGDIVSNKILLRCVLCGSLALEHWTRNQLVPGSTLTHCFLLSAVLFKPFTHLTLSQSSVGQRCSEMRKVATSLAASSGTVTA